MRMMLVSLLVAALATAPLAQPGPRVVYSPPLDGGRITVEGLFDVVYVGDARHAARPEVLRTSWVAVVSGKAARVTVTEERLPGQDARSWQVEHQAMVSKVALSYPPALRRRSAG